MDKGAACVVCNGCPENRVDAARAETYLLNIGYHTVKNWREADLILFNGCAGNEQRTGHSLSVIKEIQENKKPNQQLVVWGCLPKIFPETLKKEYQGLTSEVEFPALQQLLNTSEPEDLTAGNYLVDPWPYDKNNASWLARYEGPFLSRSLKRLAVPWVNYVNRHFNLAPAGDKSTFYIKTSTGCRGKCAYCVVPQSRGTIKSKPVEKVVNEFQEGLRRGFKRFSLLGTDLGSYGADIGCNLCDLLKELVKQEGNFKINLRNVHPRFLMGMMNEFIPILETEKIRYIETPAESGSDRILKLMNRPYTIQEYKEYINTLRRAYPNIIIRSQIIAGFPTETEDDFQKSMKLLDELVFDYVEVYEYSEMPKTLSEKIKPKVPDAVKKQRYMAMYKKALLNRTPRKIKRIILRRT